MNVGVNVDVYNLYSRSHLRGRGGCGGGRGRRVRGRCRDERDVDTVEDVGECVVVELNVGDGL